MNSFHFISFDCALKKFDSIDGSTLVISTLKDLLRVLMIHAADRTVGHPVFALKRKCRDPRRAAFIPKNYYGHTPSTDCQDTQMEIQYLPEMITVTPSVFQSFNINQN